MKKGKKTGVKRHSRGAGRSNKCVISKSSFNSSNTQIFPAIDNSNCNSALPSVTVVPSISDPIPAKNNDVNKKLDDNNENSSNTNINPKILLLVGVFVLLGGLIFADIYFNGDLLGPQKISGFAAKTSGEQNGIIAPSVKTTSTTSIGTEETTQGAAEIGKPVSWSKKITANSQQTGIQVEVPTTATDIKATKGAFFKSNIDTGKIVTSSDKNTIAVKINDKAKDYDIKYTTNAPKAEEQKISETHKKIIISSDVHYQNIATYGGRLFPSTWSIINQSSTNDYTICPNFNSLRASNQLDLYFKLIVPSDSFAGNLSTTITATAYVIDSQAG